MSVRQVTTRVRCSPWWWLLRRGPHDTVPTTFRVQRHTFLRQNGLLARTTSILDVGCGHGISSSERAVALDLDLTMLQQHLGRQKLQASAYALPFPARSFDVVMVWDMLHHLAYPVQALREAVRVCRRAVVVFEPNPQNPVIALLSVVTAHRGLLFSAPRFAALLRASGGTVRMNRRGGWILPNATPAWTLPLLRCLPYAWPGGVSLIGVVVPQHESSE